MTPNLWRIGALLLVLAVVVYAFVGCSTGETSSARKPVNEAAVANVRPDGLISDTAGKLTDGQIKDLQIHAETAGRDANMQIGVAVVGSLNGRTIEEVALNTARDWGVGKFSQNGRSVLIMIAPNERKTRLEVSRHFEGVLTDGQAGQVLDLARPEFRSQQWASGLHKIIDGVKAKGQQNLTMINPLSGTMLGFAAPLFLGLGLAGWFVILLLIFLVGFLLYRFFFGEEETVEETPVFEGSPYAPYRRVDGGQTSTRVNSSERGGYIGSTRRDEDGDSGLGTAAAIAVASAAYEPERETVTLPSTFEPLPASTPESFGGAGDFAGGGATRAIEVEDAPVSNLFQSSTPLSSGGSSSWDSNDSDSSSDSSSSSDSGGSSDF